MIKPGTLKHGTPRKSGGTTEQQRNTNIHQRNTQEEQLHLNIDYKLKLSKHLERTLKKAVQNVNAFLRILLYQNFEKRSIFMNFFYVTVAFQYRPLVRMFCSRKMNNKTNHLQERCLCIV